MPLNTPFTLDEILAQEEGKRASKTKAHIGTKQTPQSTPTKTVRVGSTSAIEMDDALPKTVQTYTFTKNPAPNLKGAMALLLQDTPFEALEDKKHPKIRKYLFYWLSRREYSRQELLDKCLDKGFDATDTLEVLDEFDKEGYQSDMRFALALARMHLDKGRGKRRLQEAFVKHKLRDYDADVLIARIKTHDMAEIDWVREAMHTRQKKFGSTLPTSPKEKQRQLRFLLYRGYEMSVAMEALHIPLDEYVST